MEGRQLRVKREDGKQPRAIIRIYSRESIEALNQIAKALNKKPSAIVQDWIASAHADMVDDGRINPADLNETTETD